VGGNPTKLHIKEGESVSNKLDSLMMRADLANKQRREDGMSKDEYGRTPNDHFIMELQNMGLYVRDHDYQATLNLSFAVKELHRELSKLDKANIGTWANVPLLEVVNIYARNQELGLLGVGRA
tara:strand:+ start:212 stop:580 length:369 start_codon:yes stop_codon:yes gene_type:complete